MNPFVNSERCPNCSHSNNVAKFAITALAVAFVAFASSYKDDTAVKVIKEKHKKARIVTIEAIPASPSPSSSPIEVEKVGDK